MRTRMVAALSCTFVLSAGSVTESASAGGVNPVQADRPDLRANRQGTPQRAGTNPLSAVASRPVQQDPKALEVLKEALKVLGGEAAILGRKSIYIKRKIINHEYPEPREGLITIYFKRPDRLRKEISYPGLKHIEVFDGEHAWFDLGAGPKLRGDIITNSIRVGLKELDLPANYLDAELTYFNISQEIPGKLAHVVKVRKDGYTRELMFDVNTNLLEVCGEYENPWGATDKMTKFDRYRPVSGIMVPHREEKWRSNRMITESEILEIEFNGEIDDALFEMPPELAKSIP